MDPSVITTEADYRRCFAELEGLAQQDPDPSTPEGQRLQWLARVVEEFERREFSFGRSDDVTCPQWPPGP